jgi:hypothetical protein
MLQFKKFIKTIWYLPRRILCAFIRLYQKTISFDHGPLKRFFPYGYCKFKPTCSDYCYQSIKEFGLIKGGFKCLYRVLRCNPCGKGGYDPVHKH